ncbi:ribosomal subunit interface protein [Formosa agariphila KMM 3901]|uniref:Ribosomal subunit interface protein n=1 Tax=Formosa agariphila (strain DSM 15362 / KCTC 12365 / LMG 23005 / KMM 3901 / M-2Alg 35-1) TaxID=1347342 RepID=T2KNV4_FORAG|nr:HPF/RaiA family ribosome-associated protein [Formosa agariphila]CDF80415.1 ribosomal subunit interface protein [Formosa agariphila KMM 3901]
MELQFEYVNIPKNNYFEYLAEEHLNPLAKKFPIVIEAKVLFKVENTSVNIDNVCLINLKTKESSIVVEAHETSIEQAIHKTSKSLENELQNTYKNN